MLTLRCNSLTKGSTRSHTVEAVCLQKCVQTQTWLDTHYLQVRLAEDSSTHWLLRNTNSIKVYIGEMQSKTRMGHHFIIICCYLGMQRNWKSFENCWQKPCKMLEPLGQTTQTFLKTTIILARQFQFRSYTQRMKAGIQTGTYTHGQRNTTHNS